MADFDPDSYIAEKGGAFDPDAYLKAKAGPPAAPAADPGFWTSAGRGAAQGATLGFGDELTGAIQAIGQEIQREQQGPQGLEAFGRMAKDYRESRDSARRENDEAEKAHGGAYLTGNLAGGLVTAPLMPGGAVKAGAGFVPRALAMAGTGAKLGAAAGLGGSKADLLQGQVLQAAGDTAKGAGLGAAAGLAGAAVGAVPRAVARAADRGLAGVDESVARSAAARAAAETASARSAAGAAAQDAYRQLEHLRELGRLGQLTPEQAQQAAQLAQELGDKATEKLLPAAANKAVKGAEYAQAAQTEGQRASTAAAEKLSGAEALRQVVARTKRYGPMIVEGALGHGLMPGLGTAGGAAAGLVLRPAIRSAFNLAKTPAVKAALYRALGATASGAEPAAESAVLSAQRGLSDDELRRIVDAIPGFADKDKSRRTSTLAALQGLAP